MKIEIESLARVEGHGGILVEMEGKRVKNVQFSVFEGPRLIEALTVGKTPAEDVSLVCRICAICTTSHRYAALRALERALGIEVSPKTRLTRTLMHLGEMVESHSLHVFLLSLPDFLGRPSAVDMLDKYADEVKLALRIKKLGNSIMTLTTDRMIHGENPVLGGFGRFPSAQSLTDTKREAENLLPLSVKALELVSSFSLPTFFEKETLFVALKPEGERFGFVGDTVLLSTGEERSIEDYKALTNERVVPHSFSKRSLYQGQPFTVGSLARVNLMGERLDGEAGACFKKYYQARWKKNPLFNILAQALELVHCLEQIPRLADEIMALKDSPIVTTSRTEGEATGAVEAPRGTLYHHYRLESGLIAEADIVTPTAQNLDDIERYFRLAAENMPSSSESDLGQTLEIIARAYDPCISCSTHLVEIRGSERFDWQTLLSPLVRDPEGPLFVGMGNADRSDDGVGLAIARRLRALGREGVLLEDEWQNSVSTVSESEADVTIFIDAGDFGGTPGEIRLLPLESIDGRAVSTHRALPALLRRVSKRFGNNQYLLAVQPSSTTFASKMSPPVSAAADEIVRFLTRPA